jgi:hypothetical protein
MVNLATFQETMRTRGWMVIERFVEAPFVARMLSDLERAYGICRGHQIKNGVDAVTEGTLHHLIGQGDTFIELIDRMEPLMPHLEWYFRGKFILNSFGGNILKKSSSYANAIHRDIRTYSGDMPLLLNTLLTLDDFTVENGATFLMTGGHRLAEKPTDQQFYAVAQQAVAPAGSLLLFDSNLWHAAGVNQTDRARRSVTPMYCKPFMKQQFDYPRAVGYDQLDQLSELRRQLLGYYSRVPATLDEWYQPPERRMYRPGQG